VCSRQTARRRTFAAYSHHVIPGVAGGDRRLRVRDTPAFTRLNLAVLFTAAASALVGGVSWLLTFTPWTQFMSSGYFQPFFLLIFPLFGWSVFVRSVRRPERDRRQATGLLNEFPPRWRLTFGLIVTAVFATSLAAMVSLPGQPEYEPGSRRYVYNDHGTLIPATRAAYLHAVAVQNRLFLGAALVSTSFAVAITWQERNRRRRDLVTPRGGPRPVRPHPKIPLLAAALALTAAVALAGSIASGALILGRLGAYNADGIYLHAGHPVRALLGPDHYVVYVGCTEEMICAQLPLSGLSVRTASGGILATSPDPSSDHLDQAVGEVSFTVPVKEVVSLDLSTHLGQPAFVIRSEGGEAHALIGWIILAGLSLLVLLAALVSLGVLLARRTPRWQQKVTASDGTPGLGS
jgi:hypothetical protein